MKKNLMQNNLMETVLRYVMACDRRGWRPVFTQEQFQAIALQAMYNLSTPHGRSGWTLYGVEFTIDSDLRPMMPENLLG